MKIKFIKHLDVLDHLGKLEAVFEKGKIYDYENVASAYFHIRAGNAVEADKDTEAESVESMRKRFIKQTAQEIEVETEKKLVEEEAYAKAKAELETKQAENTKQRTPLVVTTHDDVPTAKGKGK